MAKYLLRPVLVTFEVFLLCITALLAILAASATEITVLYRMMLGLWHPVAAGVFVAAAQSRWPLPRWGQRTAVIWLGIYWLVTVGFIMAVSTGWTSGYLLSELALSVGGIELDLTATLSARDVIVPTTLCFLATVTFAVLLAMQIDGRLHSKPGS